MNRQAVFTILTLIGLLGLNIQHAQAHAWLEKSIPGAGQALESQPEAVVLRFDTKLELPFCRIRIEDTAGQRLDEGQLSFVDDNNDALRLALPPLAPGTYHVFWSVVSRDGHLSDGDFRFTVK